MKKLFFYLIIFVSLSSCVTARNVEHKPQEKIEASPNPEERKSTIKEGRAIGIMAHAYSAVIVGVCIFLLFDGGK